MGQPDEECQVHKSSCVGPLEERMEEMIDPHQEVAEDEIGTGEGWLTEL